MVSGVADGAFPWPGPAGAIPSADFRCCSCGHQSHIKQRRFITQYMSIKPAAWHFRAYCYACDECSTLHRAAGGDTRALTGWTSRGLDKCRARAPTYTRPPPYLLWVLQSLPGVQSGSPHRSRSALRSRHMARHDNNTHRKLKHVRYLLIILLHNANLAKRSPKRILYDVDVKNRWAQPCSLALALPELGQG